MKSRFVVVFLLLGAWATMSSSSANAQHSVKLSFTPSVDSPSTNVYREPGTCPASVSTPTTFTKLSASPISGNTFTDSAPLVGLSCYYVTAIANGLESVPSNLVQVSLPPAPPTNLSLVSVAAVLRQKVTIG